MEVINESEEELCPKLELNIEIPDHSNELSRTEYTIQKIRNRISKIDTMNSITDKLHVQIYEEIIKSLDYVGKLSKHIFSLENTIETMYTLKYIHCPDQVLVKRRWYKHYEELHQPYSILKNRCFKLLDELDEVFINKFGKNPSNYNY